MAGEKKPKKPKTPKTPKAIVAVKGYTRRFSAAKLPPREGDGKWRRRNAQGDLFATRRR
jgi:hypothetical protein